MYFFRYNSNPKGWKAGDCVVRAISTAIEAAYKQESWNSVFESLCNIGAKKCRMPNDSHVYAQYLKEHGFMQMKQMKHDDGTKYTVDEVLEAYSEDIVLVHCAHHLTCGIRGNLYDTWNCGWRTAGKFYLLPKSSINEETLDLFEYKMLPYLED